MYDKSVEATYFTRKNSETKCAGAVAVASNYVVEIEEGKKLGDELKIY